MTHSVQPALMVVYVEGKPATRPHVLLTHTAHTDPPDPPRLGHTLDAEWPIRLPPSPLQGRAKAGPRVSGKTMRINERADGLAVINLNCGWRPLTPSEGDRRLLSCQLQSLLPVMINHEVVTEPRWHHICFCSDSIQLNVEAVGVNWVTAPPRGWRQNANSTFLLYDSNPQRC